MKNEERKKRKKQKPTEQQQRERQSVTGTRLLAEPSSGRHHIQLSFLLFTDDNVFDIILYTSRAKEFSLNLHYTLLL